MTDRKKSLKPFNQRLIKRYIRQKYDKFMDFIEELLNYIETQNTLPWYTTDAEREENSLYENIVNGVKFGSIETVPVENRELLYSYFINYAAGFNLDTYAFNLRNPGNPDEDLEMTRQFIKYANQVSRMKGTHKAYRFFMELIAYHYYDQDEKHTTFKEYFIDTFDDTLPPDYTTVLLPQRGEEEQDVIMVEYPIYYYDDNGDIQRDSTVTNSDKGKRPFEYQIVSVADIMKNTSFIKNIRENLQPAGFNIQIMTTIDEIITNLETTQKVFIGSDWQIGDNLRIPFDFNDAIAGIKLIGHIPEGKRVIEVNFTITTAFDNGALCQTGDLVSPDGITDQFETDLSVVGVHPTLNKNVLYAVNTDIYIDFLGGVPTQGEGILEIIYSH
jgi:hypothetical protein